MTIDRLFGRVKRGDDVTFNIVQYTVNGQPQDLTEDGWSVLLQIRPSPESSTFVQAILDEEALANSQIIASLVAADTVSMDAGDWCGDIQVTSPNWTKSSETFKVIVEADVSRV